jgi:hypothetical protein
MMEEQLKAPFIKQYSKDSWPICKTMVLAFADVIDAAEFLSGPANHQKILRPKQPGTKRKFISASNF